MASRTSVRPGTSRRKTSMADIAKAAGVSEATVDRVLNGRGGVSREKEMSVLEWARKLEIDRALKSVSVRWLRIAILLQQPVVPYYVSLKQGFEVAQKTFEHSRVLRDGARGKRPAIRAGRFGCLPFTVGRSRMVDPQRCLVHGHFIY